MPISETVQRWWPLPDSLDLVRAPIKIVASAVLAEVTRFVAGGQLSSAWVPFSSLDQVFASVALFTNVPTVYFVLPTRSEWSVLWNNSFLCDGYDSLCWCLATSHALSKCIGGPPTKTPSSRREVHSRSGGRRNLD